RPFAGCRHRPPPGQAGGAGAHPQAGQRRRRDATRGMRGTSGTGCALSGKRRGPGVVMVRTAQVLLLLALGSVSAAAGLPAPPAAGVAAAGAAAAGGPLLRVPQDVPTLAQALRQVANGGVIELAAATYPAPAAGFKISNARKSFTIRGAAGATAILDGG